MKPLLLRPAFLASVCLLLGGLLSPLHCVAESYSVYSLHLDQGSALIGLESSGAVVIDQSVGGNVCGAGATDCYFTYVDGSVVSTSAQAPSTSMLDDGTACSPSMPSGFQTLRATCNGTWEAISGYAASSNIHTASLYSGADLSNDFVAPGDDFKLFLDANGDMAFDNILNDTIYEAIPEAPEPSSLWLCGTGVLAALLYARRLRTA